ncbi:MAG: adenine phosphoribosyltransferase [Pseudomonadota bacterium]
MSYDHQPFLRRHIRVVPDFPKPGIQFYDISTLLAHAGAWRTAIHAMAREVETFVPDTLVAIESRGFIFAAPIAVQLGLGMVMVRKRGKLPGNVHSHAYTLEYGDDVVEVSADLVQRGQKVVLIDDLLATGGTGAAAIELLQQAGVETLGSVFLMELIGLGGAAKLGVPCRSVLQVPA